MLRLVLAMVALAAAGPVSAGELGRFNGLYGQLLDEYWRPAVTINGVETTVFDYAAMQREAGPLMDDIADTLEAIDPAAIEGPDERKAFWINVYNFTAMRMVIDAYPVDSITSFKISLIKHPWSKDAIKVGGRDYSLSEIEKEVLLQRFDDPRIIFAVSCAAVSCPDRSAEPFAGDRLDARLDELIRTFFRNPAKGLSLNRQTNTLTLAWILEKDDYLFEEYPDGVLGFVKPYLDAGQRAWLATHPVRLDYFDHDWTLNDLAQADGR